MIRYFEDSSPNPIRERRVKLILMSLKIIRRKKSKESKIICSILQSLSRKNKPNRKGRAVSSKRKKVKGSFVN